MLEATVGVLCFIGAIVFVALLSPKRTDRSKGATQDRDASENRKTQSDEPQG